MVIRGTTFIAVIVWALMCACTPNTSNTAMTEKDLADAILKDAALNQVETMAKELLRKGVTAGSGYEEVWIRDINTFIETSCDVYDTKEIRRILLTFFGLQQENGEIVDSFVTKEQFNSRDPVIYTSARDPAHIGFKNTVATDQETSLIQAVGKYIEKTGDRAILDQIIDGKTVRQRMSLSIDFLLKNRYATKYGLLTGATTQDWGDVQPEDDPGVKVTSDTHWCCDIYDNAMFIIALDAMIRFSAAPGEKNKWTKLKEQVSLNVRKYLWDDKRHKFIPHLYLGASPFPADFDESGIHFHGGTAVAIEAGLLSKEEISIVNRQMVKNARMAGAPSIGMTVYPPYPKGFFKNGQTSKPYSYQNGGDWTWFGGRMIQQLVANGFVQEAYDEVRPMIDRVIKYDGFYEWYDNRMFSIRGNGIQWFGKQGQPHGSRDYRGAAGVLAKSIGMLRAWALEVKSAS